MLVIIYNFPKIEPSWGAFEEKRLIIIEEKRKLKTEKKNNKIVGI